MISEKLQRLKYVICDYIATNVAWVLFNIVRYYFLDTNRLEYESLEVFLLSHQLVLGQIIFPLLMLGIFYLSGYYNKVFLKSRLQEIVVTFSTSFVGMLVIYFIAIINDNIPDRLQSYELMAILFGIMFGVVYSFRFCITQIATHNIHRRIWQFNTLIIGTSQAAVKLEEKLRTSNKSMGFNIVGYVESCSGHTPRELNLPIYPLDNLNELCEKLNIKNIIIIPHRNGMNATMNLINRLFSLDLPMYISPDLYHLLTTKARVSNVVGEPLVDISKADMSESTINIKRVSDVFISILALIIISPLMLALAILIKFDSKGPVIYKQKRIGYHKKAFNIYKFRSMKVNAEANGPTLSSLDDPRITKLGKIMRKYRLDELPQFWNVVKGDMSLVGPRPEREFYIKQIISKAPYYSLIHQVRPGITSWGMVKFGYASNVDEMISRLKYDLLYIENVSFAVDLKILFYTIHTVFTGKGI